jgi:hypothetical protein
VVRPDPIGSFASETRLPAGPILVEPPRISVDSPEGRTLLPAAEEELITGLKDLDQQVHQQARTRTVAEVAVASGVVATAGYVFLSPRLALWFLGALAARRAVWKPFDPLEVVYAWERDEKKRKAGAAPDDDSLESMVAK